MDDQLNEAPCGYFTMTEAGVVASANAAFAEMMGAPPDALADRHIETMMSVANKLLFHTYFYPVIRLNGRVDELYFSLRSIDGRDVPVLLNGRRRRRDGIEGIECVVMPMTKRIEYENEIRNVKNSLELAVREKDEAFAKLEALHRENERRQAQLVELNEKLERAAITDVLTGLTNRRRFQDLLAEMAERCAREGTPFSLLLADIDHFKRVNDTLGHHAGDRVLEGFARILESVMPDEGVAARFGGEEFVALLPGSGVDAAKRVGERLRAATEYAPWTECAVTVSVGAATFEDGDTEASIVHKADEALYASKRAGRNRVTHASEMA